VLLLKDLLEVGQISSQEWKEINLEGMEIWLNKLIKLKEYFA
jgi:hypothetical protein